MGNKIMNINSIPSPTYRWLKMNYSTAESFSGVVNSADIKYPACCRVSEEAYSPGGIATGIGTELDEIFVNAKINKKIIKIPDGCNDDQPVRVDVMAKGEDNGLLPVELFMGKASSSTVIVRLMAEDETYSRQALQLRLHIGEGAKLSLVTICVCRGREVFLDIGADVSENGSFGLTQLFLSGSKVFSGCKCSLTGKGSELKTDIAYHTAGDDLLDMNYVADHIGKRTQSEINVAGVLKDRASKLFRGTIDFKRGAKGAKGNEQEDVLLLDDNVVNKTIPVILCAEEDVEGNHGATIGKLPGELLFYMNSRGMDTQDIYDMMARARIESVCRLIEDEAARDYVMGLDIFGGGEK